MKDAANWSLFVLALMVSLFTLLYVFRSPWWRNTVGKIYLAKSIVLSLVLVQITVASLVSTEYPGRQYIRLGIYVLGALVYVPMIWSLVRQQNHDRRARRDACPKMRAMLEGESS